MLSKHIKILEMEAVFRTCHHFQDSLRNKLVLVRCDNMTVVSYINKEGGTRSPSLGMLAWKLMIWAQKTGISLVAEHVPGVDNCLADRLSRVFASSLEWRLKPGVVQKIFLRWDYPLTLTMAHNFSPCGTENPNIVSLDRPITGSRIVQADLVGPIEIPLI
jgi:hypothetical protein